MNLVFISHLLFHCCNPLPSTLLHFFTTTYTFLLCHLWVPVRTDVSIHRFIRTLSDTIKRHHQLDTGLLFLDAFWPFFAETLPLRLCRWPIP